MQIDMYPIGILGGTFDPVHNGHILPALEVSEYFSFSKLLMIPLDVAVHRPQPMGSSEQRLAMCHLTADPHSIIEVDDREIRRGGGSYTVDTLEELRTEYGPEQSLVWLMGRDSMESFTEWEGWQRILELAHLVVMQRPGYAWEAPLPAELQPYQCERLEGLAGSIVLKTVQQQDISSTQIREKLACGEFVRGALDQNVRKYLLNNAIYTSVKETP